MFSASLISNEILEIPFDLFLALEIIFSEISMPLVSAPALAKSKVVDPPPHPTSKIRSFLPGLIASIAFIVNGATILSI